jgi:hypothetical protein
MEIKYSLKDFDKNKIINKFGMQKNGSASLFLANTCFRRMAKYVPKDTGALMTTVTVKPGSVTYEQPYAHRQFISNKGKGIRGKRWDLAVKNNEMHQIEKEVENYVKKTKGSK